MGFYCTHIAIDRIIKGAIFRVFFVVVVENEITSLSVSFFFVVLWTETRAFQCYVSTLINEQLLSSIYSFS